MTLEQEIIAELFGVSRNNLYLCNHSVIVHTIMDKVIKYYRHFKGGKYLLLTEGKESESLEDVIVYKALYGEGKVWVRPKSMFFDTVVRNGVEMPRFQEISKEEAYAED